MNALAHLTMQCTANLALMVLYMFRLHIQLCIESTCYRRKHPCMTPSPTIPRNESASVFRPTHLQAYGWLVNGSMNAAAAGVDLSGDGGVLREMVREGDGKGLASGDIAMVRFTGTVAETGQASGWPQL